MWGFRHAPLASFSSTLPEAAARADWRPLDAPSNGTAVIARPRVGGSGDQTTARSKQRGISIRIGGTTEANRREAGGIDSRAPWTQYRAGADAGGASCALA